MPEYSLEDIQNVKPTSDGYKASVKGQQKNLERSNADDAHEIALMDEMTVNEPRK